MTARIHLGGIQSNMSVKRQEFFEMYKELCKEYRMYIDIGYEEGSSNGYPIIDDVLETKDLDLHFKEVAEDIEG